MSKKNLMLGFNHVLLNVKDEQFNIGAYREGREGEACLNSHECNTVGCFIGHCTILDKKENLLSNIDFQNWALYFFSLSYDELSFMFSGVYACFQDNNQRIQALLRVKYFIENGKIHPDFHTRKFKLLMKEEQLKPYTEEQIENS